MPLSVTLIAKENIPLVWDGLQEDISKAVADASYGELREDVMYNSLVQGAQQLWLCVQKDKVVAWLITSIVAYAGVQRLRFVLLGGEKMEDWLQHVDIIEQWAAGKGCTEVEAWVRPGLRKRLRKYGYMKAYEVVVKELVNRALI